MPKRLCTHPRCKKPLHKGQQKYCSVKCWRAHYEILNPPKQCKRCRAVLYRKRRTFCTWECAALWQREDHEQRRIARQFLDPPNKTWAPVTLTTRQSQLAATAIRETLSSTLAESEVLFLTVHGGFRRFPLKKHQRHAISTRGGSGHKRSTDIMIDPRHLSRLPEILKLVIAAWPQSHADDVQAGPRFQGVSLAHWLTKNQWFYDARRREFHHPSRRVVTREDFDAQNVVVTSHKQLQRLFDSLAKPKKKAP